MNCFVFTERMAMSGMYAVLAVTIITAAVRNAEITTTMDMSGKRATAEPYAIGAWKNIMPSVAAATNTFPNQG